MWFGARDQGNYWQLYAVEADVSTGSRTTLWLNMPWKLGLDLLLPSMLTRPLRFMLEAAATCRILILMLSTPLR